MNISQNIRINEKKDYRMESLKNKSSFISDMDGVIYHGNKLLPGTPEFVNWLIEHGKKFLFLTILVISDWNVLNEPNPAFIPVLTPSSSIFLVTIFITPPIALDP